MKTTKQEIEEKKRRRENAVSTACSTLGWNGIDDSAFDALSDMIFSSDIILEMIWSPQHKKSVMGLKDFKSARHLRFLEAMMFMDPSTIKEKTPTSVTYELCARSFLCSRRYRVTMRFIDSEMDMIQHISIELTSHLFGFLKNDAAPLMAAREMIYNNALINTYFSS